jgi:biopolymer transport protein ExbD
MPALKPLLVRGHARHARIEIIPLIDVIFFLLATFVLFTLSLNRIVVLDVELPETARPDTPPPEIVTLRIADPDTLYWGPDPLTRAELPAKLAQYKATEKDRRIMIASDPGVLLGTATDILDEVRGARDIKVTFDMRRAAASTDDGR